jgi:hypothetical protein
MIPLNNDAYTDTYDIDITLRTNDAEATAKHVNAFYRAVLSQWPKASLEMLAKDEFLIANANSIIHIVLDKDEMQLILDRVNRTTALELCAEFAQRTRLVKEYSNNAVTPLPPRYDGTTN